MKYPADLMVSFVEAVGNCSYEERFFIVQKINKLFDKNTYKLLVNHDGEYTNIGMLLGAFREVLLFSIVEPSGSTSQSEFCGCAFMDSGGALL